MDAVTQYKVLFASPGDLKHERERFPQVIDEINRVWGIMLGFQIVPIMYEYSSGPGASVHSSQSLISKDFGDDYDVFIGAYWQKYGTPTLDALSGTEEEFNNAYKRFCENPSSVQILFYFKETPPASLSEINVEELSKIRAFKTFLEQKNILYWTFTDLPSFEQCIREHLPRRLLEDKVSQNILPQKDIQRQLPEKQISYEINQSIPTEDDIDDSIIETEEFGILDYREIFDSSIASSISCLQNISSQTHSFTQLIKKATRQLNRENSKLTPSTKNVRAICLSVVAGSNKLSDNYETEIPTYFENFRIAVETMVKIQTLYSEKDEISTDLDSIYSLSDSINESKKAIIEFRTVIADSTCLIKEQKKANKRLLQNFDNYIKVCDASLELINQLIISIS
ncbi:hypothetical protein SAMN05444145_10244 [Alistipes timonensis JC136]|uniref:DUF4062 domain-containing protein n=1 Tax=Alistipes timonensis JC136 TaxID=1033731 RepID=A0A1H3Z1D1_9BACT|nr:hypothetical protein [Alistipes timonensis]SEA17122.1 hypothetical protein SAMN05444145_10244 [Alistipes timonensis JC136]